MQRGNYSIFFTFNYSFNKCHLQLCLVHFVNKVWDPPIYRASIGFKNCLFLTTYSDLPKLVVKYFPQFNKKADQISTMLPEI